MLKALDALDDPCKFPGFNPIPEEHVFHEAWGNLAELEDFVSFLHSQKRLLAAKSPSEHTQRSVFLCHKNDAPPRHERYDPFIDVQEKHIGIVQVLKRSSSDRGWDVVRFDSPRRIERYGDEVLHVVDVTYMQPARLGRNDWPDNWENRTFVPMPGRGRGTEWVHKSFPLDNVVWSTEPKHNSFGEITWKIPTAVQQMARKAVDRIVAWNAVHRDLDEAERLIAAGQVATI